MILHIEFKILSSLAAIPNEWLIDFKRIRILVVYLKIISILNFLLLIVDVYHLTRLSLSLSSQPCHWSNFQTHNHIQALKLYTIIKAWKQPMQDQLFISPTASLCLFELILIVATLNVFLIFSSREDYFVTIKLYHVNYSQIIKMIVA